MFSKCKFKASLLLTLENNSKTTTITQYWLFWIMPVEYHPSKVWTCTEKITFAESKSIIINLIVQIIANNSSIIPVKNMTNMPRCLSTSPMQIELFIIVYGILVMTRNRLMPHCSVIGGGSSQRASNTKFYDPILLTRAKLRTNRWISCAAWGNDAHMKSPK